MTFVNYREQIPDQEGENWYVYSGALFCVNFKVGSDQPLQEHFDVISDKLVPFMHRAILKLGNKEGDRWILNIKGSASASGKRGDNIKLSERRAKMLGEFAIAEFNDRWLTKEFDKPLPLIRPNYYFGGDNLAKKDPSSNLKSNVDKYQGHYRSVIFFFTAAAPARDITFGGKFRSVNGLIMKPSTTTNGQFFDELKNMGKKGSMFAKMFGILEKIGFVTPIARVLSEDIVKLSDRISTVLNHPMLNHPALLVGKHVVSVMVPSEVRYGYEMYDSRGDAMSVRRIYRFDGTEHSDNVDLLELIGFFFQWKENVKTLKQLGKYSDKFWEYGNYFDKFKLGIDIFKIADEITKVFYKLLVFLGETIGGMQGKILMAKILDNYEAFGSGAMVATSDWGTFIYHKSAPRKNIDYLAGPAQRFKAGGLYFARQTLEFGGPVPNNWIEYNAIGELQSFSIFENSLLQYAKAKGRMVNIGSMHVIE